MASYCFCLNIEFTYIFHKNALLAQNFQDFDDLCTFFRNVFSSQFMHFSRQFLRDEKQFPPTHSLFGWLCYICNLNKFLSCIILLHFVTFVINIRLKLNLFDTFYKCCLELNLTNTFGSCVNILRPWDAFMQTVLPSLYLCGNVYFTGDFWNK